MWTHRLNLEERSIGRRVVVYRHDRGDSVAAALGGEELIADVPVRCGGDELAELGTPLDPSALTRSYVKPALKRAGITKRLQPWHGLRHTALTMDAAVGNPNAYIQAKAGHSQFSITERYVHAAQTAFPGAVDRAEARIFSV